jgi:superfamily II DNA/RNA helicase
VNYDLPWNPMKIEQRIGRLSRIGQERDVYIFNLSAKGTIEDYILDVLDSKINMFELVVGEVDMILGKLEEERPFEDIVMEIFAVSKVEEDFKRRMDELGEKLLSMKRDYETVQEVEDKLFGSVGVEE